jgi:hypothetical protein
MTLAPMLSRRYPAASAARFLCLGRHDRGRRTDRQISATVAAWFVRRHEPVTETADLASVDTERAAATTADTQAALLDRLDELAAKQDEIRAMLIELQRPPTSS